jgi:hypothetical protein
MSWGKGRGKKRGGALAAGVDVLLAPVVPALVVAERHAEPSGLRRPPAGPRRMTIAAAVATAVVLTVVLAVLSSSEAHPAAVPSTAPRSAHPTVLPFTSDAPTVAPPPATSSPLAPGVPVNSGQNESDPFVLETGGRYFLYTSNTTSDPTHVGMNVPVASSTDFTAWSPVTDALPMLPPWVEKNFTWAPDVHQFGSTYVLYFTGYFALGNEQCIGDATSTSPTGPFAAASQPFICQSDLSGSIDPRVFTDEGGTNWMLWKSDQNIGGASIPTNLWSQPLSADGLELNGSPVDIMQPDQPWQGTIVEAPDMVEVDGVDWVLYSGNWFNQPAYAIGAARCAGPQGPCADTSARPLLGTDAQGAGPGEASFYQGPTGVWMLYSPTLFSVGVTSRPVDITRIGFDATGPYLAAGGPPPDLGTLPTSSRWPSAP